MPESTGSGTGSSEGEDLFEDLDKFFAPIQDVDWPETSDPAPAASDDASIPDTFGPGDPASAASTSDLDDPSTSQGQVSLPGADPEDASGETDAEPGADRDEMSSATADDWAAPSTAPEASDGPDAGMEDAPAGEGAGFMFGEGDDDDVSEDAAITEEAFAQAPSAYVDLPDLAEDDAGVAELLEDDEVAGEAPPDLDAVEAAADHFAESVRDEVRITDEPGATPPRSTEEVEIAALLADETQPEEIAEPSRTLRVGPEGLGGPSWQEPTAVEIGTESERRGPGRDMPMAFLTGLALAGVALGAILLGAGPFAIFAGAVVLFAQGEFYFALQKRHYQPATALGLVAGALVLAAGYYRGEGAMLAMVALGTFASFLWYMTVPPPHRRNVVSNIALTVL
ncbi:MAG TPA: hypothetical protein VEC15_06680, partial [Actinomycetota bacterium]|nr:hypothetical protein [Actinomycetota bacterium]